MGAIMDKTKGKAKKIEGRMTNDKLRTAQGMAEETKGDIGIKAGRAKTRVKAGVTRAKAKIERGVARVRAKARSRSRAR